MNYHILTLFPDMIEQGLNNSIIGRAIEEEIITVDAVNIRDYTNEKHGKTDDYPYGGGAGMVMQAQPVYDAWRSVADKLDKKPRTVYLTPQGTVFSQNLAKELAVEEDLVFLCGHYEGVDERVIEEIVTDSVSIGDYVVTGGELPAMVMIDAISRMIPGVLHNGESAERFLRGRSSGVSAVFKTGDLEWESGAGDSDFGRSCKGRCMAEGTVPDADC